MTYLNSMKVFQMQHMVIVILFTSLMGSSILVSIPNSSGQENIQIQIGLKILRSGGQMEKFLKTNSYLELHI